ncbi:hypothetical protein PH547_11110 [Rhizobium sp. CNPSo 3464]|uniref:hypothetical protein n=1 Tax=Rhizobium sp. CNPSo 3464 TaxID=3021406 RepID=UPI00254E7EEC|nr:hypothetical protein [Rhizobium sp. CNPSo 3464]MDK4739422.1 hypothetical protein [Rhizobium sp. CNPSo 3464]
MPLTVYLDNNVWDFLLAHDLGLAKELPADEFSICITREGEIEMLPMPNDKRDFASRAIAERGVTVDTYFGFAEANSGDRDPRVGGFNEGRFASREELGFSNDQKSRIKTTNRPRQRLGKNEGDVALGARSMHWVVLTNEDPSKNGPLKTAKERGGKVIFLRDVLASGKSLADYIKAEIGPP